MGATPFEVPKRECIELLQHETVGRLCIIEHAYPLAFPVNYRVMETAADLRIVVRTIPRAALARYEGPASFEVDHIDVDRLNAWSVIARGSLKRVVGEAELPDTYPLVADGRFQWVVLDATAISGRRFTSTHSAEAFCADWEPAGTS
jgi:nitroimidazol reductase NimA-like FMN-containing flavoprotein (pyridoxamine 5'-phosphate oxidase superfamily)